MAEVLDLGECLEGLRVEFETCKTQDESKNLLVEKLFLQIVDLGSKLKHTEAELRKEKDLEGLYREKSDRYERELQELKQRVLRNAFVYVLIDGDCMLFQDDLIKQGRTGGQEAVHQLKSAVEQYLRSGSFELDTGYKVVVRVFANVEGMTKAYREANILPEPSTYKSFIQGFNMADSLCEYVDAGDGKECSDVKLNENFKLVISSLHCHHVLFGGSADNGYARLLTPYSRDPKHSQRVTLLEGPPFAKELQALANAPFKTAAFPDVFRAAKLRRVSFSLTPPATPVTNYASAVAHNAAGGGGGGGGGGRASPPGARAAGLGIRLNRLGQRIDPAQVYSKEECAPLKARKLCNPFHILGKCPYKACSHTHGPRMTGRRLEILKYIARLSPCYNGLFCNDADCLCGHQCHREQCSGNNCKFPRAMHGVDTNIV